MKKRTRLSIEFSVRYKGSHKSFSTYTRPHDDEGIDFTAGPCQSNPLVSCVCVCLHWIESRQPLFGYPPQYQLLGTATLC